MKRALQSTPGRGIPRSARPTLAGLCLLGVLACRPDAEPAGTRAEISLARGWSGPTPPPWQEVGRGGVDGQARSFQTTFNLPEGRALDGAALVLEGLWYRATVTVNGQALPSVTGGNAPVLVPLEGALRTGENTLQIVVAPPGSESALEVGGGISSKLKWKQATLAGAPRLLLRPSVHIGSLALPATTTGGTTSVTPTARVEGAEGATVRFSAVLDGKVLQELGEATVTSGRAVGAPTPWEGELWGFAEYGTDALFMLRAELVAGGRVLDIATARTGVRSVAIAGQRVLFNGKPLRVFATRVPNPDSPTTLGPRLGELAGGGTNAIEVHGEMVRHDWLEEADELGLPVVIMPRCIGRSKFHGARESWPTAVLEAQDGRLVDLTAPHPSTILWVSEGTLNTRFITQPPLWTSALEGDPAGRPIIGKQPESRLLRVGQGSHSCGQGACAGMWITEITRQGQPRGDMWSDLASAFTDAMNGGALGGVVPTPTGRQDPGWAAAWSKVGEAIGATPAAFEGRRRVSRTEVQGAAPGTVVLLEIPGQDAVGAVADAAGSATLEAWYQGEATVVVGSRRDAESLD